MSRDDYRERKARDRARKAQRKAEKKAKRAIGMIPTMFLRRDELPRYKENAR